MFTLPGFKIFIFLAIRNMFPGRDSQTCWNCQKHSIDAKQIYHNMNLFLKNLMKERERESERMNERKKEL